TGRGLECRRAAGPAVYEPPNRNRREQRRYLAVLRIPSGRNADAANIRRRAADGVVACVHAQRAENGVSDRFSDLPAVLDTGPGDLERHDLDGHDDAPAGDGLAPLQVDFVCTGRRLAAGGGDAARKLCPVWIASRLGWTKD